MENVRARVRISGRVQGVFFRDSTRQVARRLGLSGWVRNLPDGRVEAEFQGARDDVEEAVAFCRAGPPHAAVDETAVEWLDPLEHEPGFRVR